MAIIYITTDAQVPYEQTVALLYEFHAIWCPPPSLRNWNGTPSSEQEPTVLVHRGTKNYVLLGSGVTRSNPRVLFKTHLLWSNRDLPGVRTRAIELGYTGPTNMSFLFLDDVHTARLVVSKEFGVFLDRFTSGLNVVPAHSIGLLLHLL